MESGDSRWQQAHRAPGFLRRPIPEPSLGFTLMMVVVFGLGVAYAWSRYRDPLTGLGQARYSGLIAFEVCLALTGAILIFRYRQRALGSLALVFAFYFAVPTPSKPGLEIRVINSTRQAAQLGVARRDQSWRRIILAAPAGVVTSYKTAAGNYAESVSFEFSSGTQRVAAAASELRRKFIQIRDSELALVEIRKP